ncbi:MAG: hypothetical protein H0V30_04440, partial [Chitinophagaceae bacterium]|nr:hypothetical protein [Chitinophagaceae bacterium]
MNKALALCLFFISVGNLFTANAKIWRVNNNTGITADFTTLQAAHDGAASGDTIHLEGSATSYGGLTCTKKLFIVGPGYFLDEHPNTQALQQTAQVGAFTLNDGSSGTVIIGLDFRTSNISVFANDIVIRRNNFASPYGNTPDYVTGIIYLNYPSNTGGSTGVSNIIITQNYGLQINNSSYTATNILITNNYLAANGYGGDASTENCLLLSANTV